MNVYQVDGVLLNDNFIALLAWHTKWDSGRRGTCERMIVQHTTISLNLFDTQFL